MSSSSSSSSSSSDDRDNEFYKQQRHIAMQMAATNALEKQNQKCTTAVSPSETQLIQAANEGNFEEVVRITKRQLNSEIEKNSEQIEKLKKQMKNLLNLQKH